jgi:glycosyltransferase involved in cell wall biosynthesis
MKLYERIDKLLLKSFNAVVLVAPPVNNAIKRKNNYKNEVYIPNGVDIDIFNQTKKGLGKKYWGIKPECFVFGIFARFTKEKGHELLLRAFGMSCYKNDEIKLLMFGEGPEYNNIQKIIIEYGLTQNVKVLPPNDNIDHVIHDIDCYVSASFTEGMPMVLLEAMASGIPIIATNVGAVNTLLEKGAGYLVEPGNLDALAASLLNVLDNASDLKCTSKLALDRVRQNYSADIQAERYSELYNKVCIVRH